MREETDADESIGLDDFMFEKDLRLTEDQGKMRVMNMIMTSSVHRERRKNSRFILDLPFEYRAMDTHSAHGGIVVNGGEGGFLIRSLQDMPVGTRLNVTVLFPKEFELATFEALTQIVRKNDRERGQEGFRYGVKLVQINEEDRLRLKNVLGPTPIDRG